MITRADHDILALGTASIAVLFIHMAAGVNVMLTSRWTGLDGRNN